jgi:NADH:ubiquinone oxidoreductase subunit 4 (subunit M)
MLFYVFFEASLIPLYLIIGVWGGPNRVYAAFKFFLVYADGFLAIPGCVDLSVSLLRWEVSRFSTGSRCRFPMAPQMWIFLAFLVAFAVKVPMWPVHTWLPDAHVEAPTGGSIVLAAIALKLGAYGFLRFSLPIAPDASHELSGLIIGLSLIAVIYIGFVALVQTDMKKLVAYSSIAHMGFVTLGFFIFSRSGHRRLAGANDFARIYRWRHVLLHWRNVRPQCIHDRLPITAASLTPCPSLRLSSCCSPWRTPDCQPRQVLSASSWLFWRRQIQFLGRLSPRLSTMILGAAYTPCGCTSAWYSAKFKSSRGRAYGYQRCASFLFWCSWPRVPWAMGLYPKPFTEVMHSSVDESVEACCSQQAVIRATCRTAKQNKRTRNRDI